MLLQYNYKDYLCSISGVLFTTERTLNREQQHEHALEVRVELDMKSFVADTTLLCGGRLEYVKYTTLHVVLRKHFI